MLFRSRPKSLAFNGGRACRTHEEVSQSAEIRFKREEHLRTTAAAPQKHNFRAQPSPSVLSMKCFCCKEGVIRRDVFSMGMLKAIAKARSKGENENWLTDSSSPVKDYLREELGTSENVQKIADVYDVGPFSENKLVALTKGNKDTLQVVRLTRAALLCEPCAKNFGLSRQPPTVADLCNFAPVSEMVINELALQVKS